MMIFINTSTHSRSMKLTCSEHLCICSWRRSWRLTSFSPSIVIWKTSLTMRVTSYLTVMFINGLSDSSDSDDFDFVDSRLFTDAVSFVNCFEAAWVLGWLSSRFSSFSSSSSNQPSFAGDGTGDDTRALRVARVAAVLAAKITSSPEVSAFTLAAWGVWGALGGLSWGALRGLSLNKGRSSTSESAGGEETSAPEESTIGSLGTGAILRALEALGASRWSRALEGALLRPVRLGGILTI